MKQARTIVHLAVAATLVGTGCGPGTASDGGAGDGASDSAASGPTVVIFRLSGAAGGVPGFGDVPFPSDLYQDADGTLVDDIIGFERVAAANGRIIAEGLAPLDGFARTTAAYFFLGGELDPETLPPDADASVAADTTVMLVDLGADNRIPILTRYQPTLNALAVLPHPGTVLAPATRYAIVVTTGVTGGGEPIQPDFDFEVIAALPPAERSTSAELLYGEALDNLVAGGFVASAAEVAGLAVFTTHSAQDDLVAVREAIVDPTQYPPPLPSFDPAEIAPFNRFVASASTVPSLDEWFGIPDDDEFGVDWPGGDNAGGTAHDAIGAVLTGAFPSASFLSGGTFAPVDGSGPPTLQGTAWVPVTFVFPDAPAASPNGYPVVQFGHGFGSDRTSMLEIANELCRAGYAVVAIDHIFHGTRDDPLDEASLFPGSWSGPDGFADIDNDGFGFYGLFSSVLVLRDNFRQAVADQLALIQLLANPALDLSAVASALGWTPVLDGDNLFWASHSLGGILGTMVTAYAPELRGAVLGVPGGGMVHLLTPNSPGFLGLVTGVFGVVFGPVGSEPVDSMHPLTNLFQSGLEPGDALVAAPHVVTDPLALSGYAATPRNVLLYYAVDDETLPNLATDALITALGIPVVDTVLDTTTTWGGSHPTTSAPLSGNFAAGTVTAAAVQYAPATHGLGARRFGTRSLLPGHPDFAGKELFPELPAPITIELPIREVLVQMVHFFDTARDGATPEIISTAPPVADFDGDGVTDMDELSAGTDPFDPMSS